MIGRTNHKRFEDEDTAPPQNRRPLSKIPSVGVLRKSCTVSLISLGEDARSQSVRRIDLPSGRRRRSYAGKPKVQHQSARPIGRLNEGDTDTKQGQLKELKRLLESSVLEEHKVKIRLAIDRLNSRSGSPDSSVSGSEEDMAPLRDAGSWQPPSSIFGTHFPPGVMLKVGTPDAGVHAAGHIHPPLSARRSSLSPVHPLLAIPETDGDSTTLGQSCHTLKVDGMEEAADVSRILFHRMAEEHAGEQVELSRDHICSLRGSSFDPRYPPDAAFELLPGTFWAVTGLLPQVLQICLPDSLALIRADVECSGVDEIAIEVIEKGSTSLMRRQIRSSVHASFEEHVYTFDLEAVEGDSINLLLERGNSGSFFGVCCVHYISIKVQLR